MKLVFYRIAFGMLLVLLDLHAPIDVLPDPLGYLLIFYELTTLRRKEVLFRWGCYAAGLLVVISAVTFFRPFYFKESVSGLLLDADPLLDHASGLLQLVLFYSLCLGTRELALLRGRSDLASSLRFRWRLYFGSTAAYLAAVPVARYVDIEPWIQLMTMCSIVAYFLIYLVMRRAGRELEHPFNPRS
ncbi:hypothetical protein J25TS5_42740 [Paenibacillus faecis]|uniref:hypothetical protein n=1 Tax=Paenibacillus faecis TaxID=862114 RepID=UPI001B2955AB|nr:hypothetical protein [Paenibacillus faecis]GIO87342.1 hypothetical protein J25TS5_42740 [Paenibacillus faecis]